MFSLKFFFPQFCENESRMICRVSQIVSTVVGQFGQNGQTLHEGGHPPSPPLLDEILTREGFNVLFLIISLLLPMDLNQSSYDILISWPNSILGKIIIPKFFL